jgi:hypothetical protein
MSGILEDLFIVGICAAAIMVVIYEILKEKDNDR